MITKIRSWQWPNILAIDASVIAAVWLWVFAETQAAELGMAAYAVLAMSVWLTYVSDRLFDVNSRGQAQLLSTRHQFTKRYRRQLWLIWSAVLVINVVTALISLNAFQIQKGLALLFFCLAYTSFNQLLSQRFFPKELLVALIFACGTQVFLPDYSNWQCLIIFTVICLINCLIIGWKEQSVDALLQVRSITSVLNRRWLYPLLAATILLSIFSSCLIALLPTTWALSVLQLCNKRISAEPFRVLCDAALLLGPLFYFFGAGVLVR